MKSHSHSIHVNFDYNLEVESNGINFELFFIKFFDLSFTFWINQIINFGIELYEFRTNPAYEKFDSTL